MSYQRILVPFDGSPTSHRALDEAVRLADEQKARLRIVHVIENRPVYWAEIPYVEDEIELALHQEGEAMLAQAASIAQQHGVSVETGLLEGIEAPIAELLTEEAEKWRADLLVLGTHGRHGINRLLLGSVAERVARLAKTPVLLVHGPASDTQQPSGAAI